MKTYKIFAIGFLAAVGAMTTSCSDSFLDVENPTGEVLEDYYTTDERIQEALIAAYDPIHWADWGLGQYNALNIDAEIMGDNFWVGGQTKTDMQNWHMLFNYEANENNTLSSLWTVDYSGIKRCNDLLKYLGYAKDVAPENLKSYEMQARCLRVFYYNMLWHYFGNVPFYLENLSKPPYTAPQFKADEVYKQLITELEAIIESKVLPMKYYKTKNAAGTLVDDPGQLGRMTQAMAYMMYAEMVMYKNDETRFAKALGYMKEIIADPGYQLNPTFAGIWESTGEWCIESIWEINYEQTNSERGWGSPLAVGGTVLPTLIAPNSFPGDAGWSKGADGWGFLPVKLETYQMFRPTDKRRDATCWDVRGVKYTDRYQDTHIWLNKYRPFDKNYKSAPFDQNLNYNNNFRYYRYAETLLNAAELSLRTGGSTTGEAKTWLNEVRSRAGLPGLDNVTVDDVLTERNLEFVGEGKRYWDLVRAEGINGASVKNKATTVLVPDTYGYRTKAWTAKKKYIPIAQGELDSDPALVQNDYK